jgi:hypothetical protein
LRVAAVAVAAAVALAGAGVALAAATPAQYRSQATTICKATSSRLDALAQPTKKAEVNAYFKAALPIFRKQWEHLKKLDAPPVYRYLHSKVLSLEKQQIDGVAKLIGQIDDGADPEQAFKALEKSLGKVGDAETAAWKKLRIPACAQL